MPVIYSSCKNDTIFLKTPDDFEIKPRDLANNLQINMDQKGDIFQNSEINMYIQLRFVLIQQQIMGILRHIKNGIYKCDFFCSTQFLRYKDEPEYRTLLGGICSILLIGSLMVVFSNKVINTLNMMSITSSTNLQIADDPTAINFSTKGQQRRNFMFGVQIWHHNLNEGPRHFDITFNNMQYSYGEATNASIQYPLEPCTLDHWKGYPLILQKFDSLNMNYWLCPPKDLDFRVSGKYSSSLSQTLEIAVNKCTNDSLSLRPCADSNSTNNFFESYSQKVFFTIYFTNPRINPEQAEFLTYYLEDQNYIIFSQTGGEEAQIMMQDFSIVTDDSISPFQLLITQTGGIVEIPAIKNRFQISPDNDNFCTFFFYKSPNSLQITRSYQKLDEILSYIGGLFGTIAICLFIVRIYNGYSFQIDLGAAMYKHDEEKAKFNKYNFLYFLSQGFYNLLKLFGKGQGLERPKGYQRCRDQLLKQLDVLYLLKRVSYLQRAIQVILDEHQLKGIHLLEKFTLKQAQKYRKNFKLFQKTIEECENYQYCRKNSNTTANSPNIPIFRSNSVQNEDSLNFTVQNLQIPQPGRLYEMHQDKRKESKEQQSGSSSDSQASESESPLTTLQMLLRLKEQKDLSSISHRIYDNLSVCLKKILEKMNEKGSPSEDLNDYAQIIKNLKTIDFKPKRRYESTQQIQKLALTKLLQLQPIEGQSKSEKSDNFEQLSNT